MRPPPDGRSPTSGLSLRERLGSASPALRFAGAVVDQAAHPLGAVASEGREASVVEAVCAILAHAAAFDAPAGPGDSALDPVQTLVGDPVLLSAFFQNVDLLYEAEAPEADRVGAWILAAVGRIGRAAYGDDGDRDSPPSADAEGE